MQVSTGSVVLIPVFVMALHAQAPPHSGWKFVPGGENLIANGYWDTNEEGTEPYVLQVTSGVLTATALNGYLGGNNVLAPRLETKGDFGVVATCQTAPGTDGFFIELTGSLNTGALYWQGMTQVQFGVTSGNFYFMYSNGTQANSVFQLLGGGGKPLTGTLTMELLHQQGQFFLYFNGVQYGPIADPGLFVTGYVFPGFNLFPNQHVELTQLAFEVPASDTNALLNTPVGPIAAALRSNSPGSLASVTGRTFGVQATAEELALGRYYPWIPGNTGGAPDPTYALNVVGQFNSITEAMMFYSVTEPSKGEFRLSEEDAILADAKANGLSAHCNHLIGPNSYLPTWLVNGNFTADQLTQIMTTHIQTVVGHFKGQCGSWDVVNEALNADGTLDTSSDNIWANTIGPSYIDLAYQLTRQADPSAKLYYNDNYIEDMTQRTAGVYNLIAGMQQSGTPIDGVGLQCHWAIGTSDPNQLPNHDLMVTNMANLAKMGLTVRLSEIDARILLPASDAQLADQANIFATTVQACLDSPNCVSMVVFGADDATSWIPGYYPGYGAATLFDAYFKPKPAYTSVVNTLSAAALTSPELTAAAVVNAASYANQGVAPGEIVALFPNHVGPATLTGTSLDASGRVLTQIGGTMVLFDGVAAPMIYATRNQLAAVAPYEIAGQTSTQVQVEYNGVLSLAVTLPVLPAVPAIITTNSQGTGQAVALNQDGTLNSASNPAARGTIVTIYATGEGQRNPAAVTGVPSGPNDGPVLPAAVAVGGAAARLAYAASAPGFVGLMQINLTVPQGAPTGGAVPVILTVGMAQSPSVTIAVN